MGFAEGMAAGDQGDGFLVVHGHAGEGYADVAGCGDRVGVAVRAFRVHVDQAHLHGSERVLQVTVTAVAAVGLLAGGQPLALGTPVDVLFRLPDIPAAAGETEGLEAHGLQGDVAGQNHQVGPGDLLAVFLLDRPQQTAGLVEVDVVRPAVEWGETLVAGARTAAAVGRTVSAGAVPGHADEQRTVVAEVGGPPVLGIGHEGVEVTLEGLQVEALEGFGVVEAAVQRIGQAGMLMQDLQVQLVRPPVAVGRTTTGGMLRTAAGKGALGLGGGRGLLAHL